MTESDKPSLFALVADVMAFYRQDVSPFALQVWWQACQRFDLEQVRKALTGHAMDADRGQFAPKPADLVRQLEGTATDRAALAWGKTLEAMQSVGAYTDVVFDDPAIHAVVEDLGGWVKLCRSETKDLGYIQHRFCESHRAYTGRGDFEFPRLLSGDRSPDSVFTKHGLKPPRPALIGNSEKASQVYLNGSQTGKVSVAYTPIEAIERGPRLIGQHLEAA
jgi:hypothetical protein